MNTVDKFSAKKTYQSKEITGYNIDKATTENYEQA